MKQVAFDNHVLLWGIREHATSGQEEMIPRTKQLLEECHRSKMTMMIPSVVLAELLTAIEPKNHAMVHNLIKQSFLVPPFDSASSVIFARLWQERQESGVIDQIRKDLGATRQELKADCMIVASAIAHKADVIYSHDEKLRKFANGSIAVLEVPRLQGQHLLELKPASAGEG